VNDSFGLKSATGLQNEYKTQHPTTVEFTASHLWKPRKHQRLATDSEAEELLEHASAEFARFYRAVRLSDARPLDLARATIADIDRENHVIACPHSAVRQAGRHPIRIAITPELHAILDEAIGDRSEGPIFLTPRCAAWQEQNLHKTYRRYRDRAGVPGDVLM
jgi:integrase